MKFQLRFTLLCYFFFLVEWLNPLMMLLGFVGVSNAQFGTCDYDQVLEVGKSYSIFSPNYPNRNYNPGTNCRWTARSDRPINMTCTHFEIPESVRCGVDVVVVQVSDNPGRRYCGTGTFSVISEGNRIVTELHSSATSPGGKFFCSLQAVATTSDDRCRCGWKNPTRIVGGKNTGVNEFPMMAGLVDFRFKIIVCGATIINDFQIITAAHCVKNVELTRIGVVVGEHDVNRADETNATRLHRVRNVIIHPRYSETTQDNDIAIVVVQTRIVFNQLVGPACLPFQHSPDTFGGNYVDVLGWGSTGTSDRKATILQKAKVHVITNRECVRYYRELTAKQMCTLEQDKDTCQYDSGGPVLWTDPVTQNIVLISLVSYGSVCADGIPSVNSKIGAHIDWILSATPQGFRYCEIE